MRKGSLWTLAAMVAAAAPWAAAQDEPEFANSLFQKGYYDMAADAYREYLDKNPDGNHVKTALYRLGESEYSSREYENALTALDKFLELEGEGLMRQRALLRKGEILYRLKRPEAAEPILAPLTTAENDQEIRGSALYYLGKLKHEDGRDAEALEFFQTLAEQLPENPLAPYARHQRAFVYLSLGEREKAATEFVAVAASNADEALGVESRFRAAEIYDSIGWYDQAVASYDKLQQDFPKSAYAEQAALGRTWALYHAGLHQEAEQAAAAYIESHADEATTPAMKYLQANCRQQQKDYTAALEMYRAIREQYPDSEFSERALYKIAWTHFLEGKKEEAKETVQTFLETYPDSPLKGDAGFLRGSILVAEQNFEDAHEEFRLVAEKYPDSEFGAEALFKVGECLVQLGRPEEAANVFESFVKRYPDHTLAADAIARLGEVKFFAASFEEAIGEFQQILAGGPDPVTEEETLYRLALTYHNMQKFKESADTFALLLERFPGGKHAVEANLRIGDYYLFEAEDPVKSMDLHEAALNADPDGPYSGKARFGLAMARFKTNDHDGAVDVFLKLMRDHPDIKLNEQTYAWAGERLFEQEKWSQAATAFESLLRAIPDYPNPERVRLRIGECSEKAGDAQAAIKHYKKVVEEAPRTESAVKANYRMAGLYESLGEGEKALQLYEAAANTNTGEVAALSRFRLGELFEEKEDFDAATRNYMLVAIWLLHEELSPKAHFRAAQCFEKAGKPDQAKKTYRDIVAEYPDSEQAKEAQTRLAELP